MARPEAVAKALYYPTAERVIGMIGRVVQIDEIGASLLDPCAGEGTAASMLARAWRAVAHGVELHAGRAAAAAQVLSWARQGSYHQITVIGRDGKPRSPHGHDPERCPFGILFLKPPYDEGADEHGERMRQEIEFLRATTHYLAPGGLLIFIPPRKILRNEVFLEFMRRHYNGIVAYTFPSPEVAEFDQVVVLARRGHDNYGHGYMAAFADPDDLPSLETAEPYRIRVPVRPTRIEIRGRAPEEYTPGDDEGAWAGQQWIAHTGEGGAHELAPLIAPRPGHQAMLLAAGSLNGLEIGAMNDNGPRMLVKGGSRKVTIEIVGDGERIQRQRIVSYLSVLDLATGELDSWQVEDDQAKTGDWFAKHGESLAAGILASHTPQFGPADLARYDFTGLRAPGILPGRTEPEILHVQREASAAVVHRWRKHKEVIVCGEMGTGKTTMAIVAAELAKARKVVVICPPHLTRKWAREIEAITGRRGAARIAKCLTDVDAFFASSATYLVLSKETAKLGARWVPACAQGSKIITREVRRRNPDPDGWPEIVTVMEAQHTTFPACPACGAEVPRPTQKAQTRCEGTGDTEGCGEPLWRAVPITAKGTKRWPLATYLSDRYARRYTLVVDEAHQHASGETDQARAVHQLISSARKVLMMTGTLYGGRASSIFHLLYRLDPAFRRAYKHTDCATFVEHHGLFETVYKEEERTSTYGYRKGTTGGRLREIPGMSPAMIPILLPFVVFVKLHDLRMDLPPYTEEVRVVEPTPEVRDALRDFQSKLKKLTRKHPRVLSAYMQACLGYPDRPDQGEAIYDIDEAGDIGDLLASAPAFEGTAWPKDEALVEIVRKEVASNRKVLVFFAQTKRRDARPRVRALLEAAGLRVVQLDSNVPPEKREQWMRDRCDDGFDVMLTNGALVETGLDLMFAHTIVQFGIEYSINRLRQSIRRSWRLGQTQAIRVIFLVYAGTMQVLAMNLIARKMRATELVDGDAAGGLAQFDDGGGNFLFELTREALAA